MLKKIRIAAAALFWLGITLLLLDISGALHGYLGWMAKVQFLPAVLALNFGVVAALVLLTLLFGRIYCSVICPLGVFQDAAGRLGVAARKKGRKSAGGFKPENKWLRYGFLAVFVLALIMGVQWFVAILAPYSSWGRITQNLFQPLYIWGNNLLGLIENRIGAYNIYGKEVWLRSVPTFVVAVLTFLGIGFLAWKGGRSWCNTVCPVGTVLGFFSRFAAFRPVIDASKCKDCKLCEKKCKASCINVAEHSIDYSRCVDCFNCIDDCKFGALKYRFAWGKKAASSTNAPAEGAPTVGKATPAPGTDAGRRSFIAITGLAAGSAVLHAQEKEAQKLDGGLATIEKKQVPRRNTRITPPGSGSAKNFYSKCTACQLCVSACPNDVLRPSGDLGHLMQPFVSYERGWCRPECTTCSEVCPAGAILPVTPEERTAVSVGHAVVDRDLCIALKDGQECGNCKRHCPAEAIKMVHSDPDDPNSIRIPAVLEERCIGCGACEYVCPSRPLSAIRVEGHETHIIR